MFDNGFKYSTTMTLFSLHKLKIRIASSLFAQNLFTYISAKYSGTKRKHHSI